MAHGHAAAALGRAAPDQGLDKGRLARPVGADQGQALAPLEREPDVGDQRPARHHDVDHLGLDHDAAAALGLGKPNPR